MFARKNVAHAAGLPATTRYRRSLLGRDESGHPFSLKPNGLPPICMTAGLCSSEGLYVGNAVKAPNAYVPDSSLLRNERMDPGVPTTLPDETRTRRSSSAARLGSSLPSMTLRSAPPRVPTHVRGAQCTRS